MYKGKSVIAIITARGGSKGVPRKNVRMVGGKPLIAYTVEAALQSSYVDRVILSSDDQEIMDAATAAGCEVPFRRPAHLASDEADSLSVVRHALGCLESSYDYMVLLQPTSPLRTAEDINGVIGLCIDGGARSSCSVVEVDKSPYWMYTLTKNALEPLLSQDKIPTRRQDMAPVYLLNGAVYVAKTSEILAGGGFVGPGTLGYVMPKSRSLDIDTEDDIRQLEVVLNRISS